MDVSVVLMHHRCVTSGVSLRSKHGEYRLISSMKHGSVTLHNPRKKNDDYRKISNRIAVVRICGRLCAGLKSRHQDREEG